MNPCVNGGIGSHGERSWRDVGFFEKERGLLRDARGCGVVVSWKSTKVFLRFDLAKSMNGDICVKQFEDASTVRTTQGLWIVNTLFSCLCTLNIENNCVPRWMPPFVSRLIDQDRPAAHQPERASVRFGTTYDRRLAFSSIARRTDRAGCDRG